MGSGNVLHVSNAPNELVATRFSMMRSIRHRRCVPLDTASWTRGCGGCDAGSPKVVDLPWL